MRPSRPDKRLLRIGLLALVAAVSYWLCTAKAETADRKLPAAARPPMFVLQVGIGRYQNSKTWAGLTGAVNDVVEMRKVLEGERYGIPAANIVTLTDAQATKAQIFEKFQQHLIARAREHFEKTKSRDAVVMFQFSGHGSQVPDVDGDEKDDQKDETLVTYDSQDAPGKNYDITDDEIFALTSELRRYTDNIVYVFDSCHSGSGTRNSEDVRRLPPRKTVPVSVGGVGTSTTRSGDIKPPDSPGAGVMPPGDDYIVITAARSGELASQRNCFEECGSSTRPVAFGNLTFYLIEELKNARSDTSYRELMENVTRRVVAEKPTQTPQIEGDKSRFVFGSLGRSEDNFTRIAGPETKAANGEREITIRTGAMQGVAIGTIVSFYDKAVTRFAQAAKIASGSVTAVTATEATVLLLKQKRTITIDDKAVVVAPDVGSVRLKVNLDADAAKLSATQKKIVDEVRSSLSPRPPETLEPRGVDLVTAQAAESGSWDVAVLKDKFTTVASKMAGKVSGCGTAGKDSSGSTAADKEVFYLAGRDFVPLFRFCMEADAATAAGEMAIATRLSNALVHLARLKSLNSIANRSSGLAGKVVVKPIRLSGPFGCENSKFTAGSKEASVADATTGHHPFSPGDVYWFEVTNNSDSDLYLTLLDMPPDGSVKLFSPRERDDEKNGVVVAKNGGVRILMSDTCRVDAEGNFLEAGPFRISSTPGIERSMIIASTDRTTRDDFKYLEMPALTSREGNSSLAGKSDWVTIETILEINDTGN